MLKLDLLNDNVEAQRKTYPCSPPAVFWLQMGREQASVALLKL